MAYGFIKILPASTHIDLPLSGSAGGTQYPSIKILNPNDGVVYVARNRDAISNNYGDWDWKVPSQSYAMLPGPFTSAGLFYLDQSGAGHQGEITVYPSQQKIDDPLFVAIGRALLAATTSMDVAEGTQPSNPGVGILRLWPSSIDESLHRLQSNGVDARFLDTASAGLVTTAMLASGAVVSKLLDSTETADIMSAAGLPAGSITALSSRYIITKQDAASYLLIAIRAASTYSGLSNHQLSTVLFVDDGATKYKLMAAIMPSSTGDTTLGGGIVLISSLAPGAHVVQLFVQGPPSAGASGWARYATLPNYEFCSIAVWEMRAPS